MEKIEEVKVSEDIIRMDTKYWHFYFNISKKRQTINGKYLFFSESKEELEKIAINELEKGGFSEAKIRTEKYKIGKDLVLCLFYENDSRRTELSEKYGKEITWKSEEDTLKGIYSEEFLSNLSPEERQKWTRGKI